MRPWLALLLGAAIGLGVYVLTNAAYQRRTIMRKVAERVGGPGRFVDIGVTLKVVVADPKGEQLLPDKPRVRILRTLHFGGVVDTKCKPARVVGPSRNWDVKGRDPNAAPPRIWYASEAQATVVLHNDPAVMGQLVYGSEGAGKTRALAMWHYFRWLEHIGDTRTHEGGQTAPTDTRLDFVRTEMFELYGADWFRYEASKDRFLMCDGTRIKLVSTYRQSKAQGSPIQGFNWSWCGRDEGQDQVDVHEDIVNRGRSAKRGGENYHQLITATAKDDSEWRTLRDVLIASGQWIKRGLSIYFSPFVSRKSIDDKISTMNPREALRRYGQPDGTIDDLPPELAVYFEWSRKRNNERFGTRGRRIDVTAAVLAGYQSYCRRGASFSILCAHDPGAIYNTTEILKLEMFGAIPTWVVVDEIQTSQTTARDHALALKAKLQNDHGIDWDATPHNPNPPGGKALIFCDPHGKGISQTDYQAVYGAFQAVGLDVFNPAAGSQTGRIKRAARIEMINRLLAGVPEDAGAPRLVVALDDKGAPVAPKLVEAFESLRKRPGDDDPEGSQRKDEADKTHAPAATGYGLWVFEQEAFTANTRKLAIAETKRMHR